MYKNKTFLALIPARGGSKGIPNKNITLINGRPLIDYTLQAAIHSNYIDKVVVSTDSNKIAECVQSNITVIKRPAELSTDESKTITAILHAIHSMKATYDYLVLLQPTQPLRESWHIDEAIEKLIDENLEDVVSISKAENHPILLRTMASNHELSPLLERDSSVRRQDFEDCYVVNGAVYINKIDTLTIETSLNDNKYGYLMESKYNLDIDEAEDLLILQGILEGRDCR